MYLRVTEAPVEEAVVSLRHGENMGSTTERLKLRCSIALHLHGFHGKQQADVPMEEKVFQSWKSAFW